MVLESDWKEGFGLQKLKDELSVASSIQPCQTRRANWVEWSNYLQICYRKELQFVQDSSTALVGEPTQAQLVVNTHPG